MEQYEEQVLKITTDFSPTPWSKQTVLYYMPQEWKNPNRVSGGKAAREAILSKSKEGSIRQKGLESFFEIHNTVIARASN
jgi:hypothetical protein